MIIKAFLMKKHVKCKTKVKLTIHSFSSSFEVIGFHPDFFGLFKCIRTLFFFAKLVTISFFLLVLLDNALSALLRERCLVVLCLNDNIGASVSTLLGADED